MELKQYQSTVIKELGEFITCLEQTNQINVAYEKYWNNKGVSLYNIEGNSYVKPYDNSIKGVPRVTIKVPTAGGKTFIACNTLKTIFDSFPLDKSKVVVWLVPSDTILQQTVKHLSDTSHPYRQKIDSHFGSTVKVYEKEALLQGASFGPSEVKEQMSILILSVQSFVEQVRNGLPRAYRENSNLLQFSTAIPTSENSLSEIDETALIQVINSLNPVVVIDESHNVESKLRIDMLNKFNPSFVLELTATPRDKSNIISFVDAIHLKKSNMVKLPVIVYNHQDTNEVISGAINLQKTLEARAILEEKEGGKYIRPIVLFQAQPKSNDDNITFEKIKEQLISSGIPEEQVKIKTSGKDEISKEDLMSRECVVRYIITVNALKEGWDCSFAYVLASLANKSSAVDVEQILGRILRQPYVSKHKQDLLNFSYVLTSSNNFIATLDKIIEGLNKSGFSEKDYITPESITTVEPSTVVVNGSFEELFTQSQNEQSNTNDTSEITEQINAESIMEITVSEKAQQQLSEIINLATQTNETFEKTIEQLDQDDIIPNELANTMKSYKIVDTFKEETKELSLPNFFIQVNQVSIFNKERSFQLLSKNLLLNEFALSQQETSIDFSHTSSEIYSIDLVEENATEYVPKYKKESDAMKEAFVKFLSGLQPEARINQIAGRLLKIIRKIDAIPEPELLKYITAVLNNLNSDKLAELANDEIFYAKKIKSKIDALSDIYAEKQFKTLLDKGSIVCQNHFIFPKKISHINPTKGMTKNLYEQEGEMNTLEKRIINDIANLDNVEFWHRNLERGKGFYLNGFINHYPDFIVMTKSKKIIVIETKGDDRDNSDSLKKLRLGEMWANKAGDNFRYFMVFDTAKLEGAKSVSEVLDIISGIK